MHRPRFDEPTISAKKAIQRLAERFVQLLHTSDFACGDCNRLRQCDQPPSDRCVIRAMQLAASERGDDQAKYLEVAMGKSVA
jgi:hypothetical protein